MKLVDDIRKVHRIAAGMAISNYGLLGLSVPVSRLTDWHPPSLRRASLVDEVNSVARGAIESEDQEAMFLSEAASWVNQIQKAGGILKFMESFSYHGEWMKVIYDKELPQ